MIRGMGKDRWITRLVCMGVCAGMMFTCLTGCAAAQKDDSADGSQDAAEETEIGSGQDAQEESAILSRDDGQDESVLRNESDDDAGKGQSDVAEAEGNDADSLEGLGISILGDSISTYDGWIPEGYNVFYPLGGDLTDVSQTWWKSLIDDTGMELCANNSSSGSTCIGDSLCIDDPMYGCSDGRLSQLAGNQGRIPDIIIIFMGTNDLLNGVPMGDNDGTKLVEEGDIENFSDAYCLMLDKLASYYPTAQIYCCSLAQVGDWGTKEPFITFENRLGLTAKDYSDQIQVIAENKGLSMIDLYHCGIEIDNLHKMTTDGVHLTPVGMEYVKDAVLSGLVDM